MQMNDKKIYASQSGTTLKNRMMQMGLRGVEKYSPQG